MCEMIIIFHQNVGLRQREKEQCKKRSDGGESLKWKRKWYTIAVSLSRGAKKKLKEILFWGGLR